MTNKQFWQKLDRITKQPQNVETTEQFVDTLIDGWRAGLTLPIYGVVVKSDDELNVQPICMSGVGKDGEPVESVICFTNEKYLKALDDLNVMVDELPDSVIGSPRSIPVELEILFDLVLQKINRDGLDAVMDDMDGYAEEISEWTEDLKKAKKLSRREKKQLVAMADDLIEMVDDIPETNENSILLQQLREEAEMLENLDDLYDIVETITAVLSKITSLQDMVETDDDPGVCMLIFNLDTDRQYAVSADEIGLALFMRASMGDDDGDDEEDDGQLALFD